MPDSKSSNHTTWLAWSACHVVLDSSFVSVEFFSSKESTPEKLQTSTDDNAASTPQPPEPLQHRT